jgi:hypothetical protein
MVWERKLGGQGEEVKDGWKRWRDDGRQMERVSRWKMDGESVMMEDGWRVYDDRRWVGKVWGWQMDEGGYGGEGEEADWNSG